MAVFRPHSRTRRVRSHRLVLCRLQGGGVVETPRLHHETNRARVLDVLKGVGVENLEIRQLAHVQRAQVATVADGLRAAGRARTQRVVHRHSAEHEILHLVVEANTRNLAVPSKGDASTRGHDSREAARDLLDRVFIVWEPSADRSFQNGVPAERVPCRGGQEALELGVFERFVSPEEAPPANGRAERRRGNGARASDQLDDVPEQRGGRQRVLERTVPVEDEGQIHGGIPQTLVCRRQALLQRRHCDQLPRPPAAGAVLLERLAPVERRPAPERVAYLRKILLVAVSERQRCQAVVHGEYPRRFQSPGSRAFRV